MTIGQGLASPNQPDTRRIATYRAGLEPNLCWGARSVTVVGNRGEPSGESRLNPLFGGHALPRVLFAILLGVGVAACAQPRTTEWAGVISGGGEDCTSFSIEILIDKDGGIVGEAALHRKKQRPRIVWDVSGRVSASNSVNMRIEDIGPVDLTLVGHVTGSSLSIAQPSSRRCDPPRSGVLKRL